MFWELSPLAIAGVMAAVIVAALVQGSIGLGFGIVLVPVLTLLAPAAVPAVPLLLSLPLTGLVAYYERQAMDLDGVPRVLAGRVVGTVIAVGLLWVLTGPSLEILFGAVILLVVALSAFQPTVKPTPRALVGAGLASGVFATTAAIGGPPVALLYQSRPGPELRATLSVVFFVGGLLSAGGLVVAGRLGWAHLLLAVLLVPAMLVGFALSRLLAHVLDRAWLRPAVLLFAAAAGVLAIVRGLTG